MRELYKTNSSLLKFGLTLWMSAATVYAGNEAASEALSLRGRLGALQETPVAKQAGGRDEVTQLQKVLNGVQKELSTIRFLIDRARADVTMLKGRVDHLETKATVMNGGLPAGPSQRSNSEPALLSYEIFDSLYQLARTNFKERRYLEAVPIFRRLVESNPDDDRADNAQYWIGECYYGAKDYRRAVLEFGKVFTFAGTNKADDAQLMLGNCYLRLGDQDRARVEFARLARYYPNSEYTALARSRLE